MTTPSQLLSARLRTQHLAGPPHPTLAGIVGLLTCVQSQDPLGAKWSLGMRTKGATEASIDAAYDRGDFLRTHILRPTWHYVLPADIRWILALTSPHVLRANQGQARELELDVTVYRRTHALITRGLEGGVHLTRQEISTLLRRGKVEATGRRLAYIMMEAELTGLVCSGAMKGKQHTYALLDERAGTGRGGGGGRMIGREEGVALLLRRFVQGHAPTTIKHFCWWSGIKVVEARQAREALRKELDGEIVDGVEWLGASTPSAGSGKPGAREHGARALFIPEYDEVLVGTADVGIPRLMADRRSDKGPGKSTFDRPILHGGAWIGTWRRLVGAKRIELELQRFGIWTKEVRTEIDAEAARYAAFAGRALAVRTRGG